MTALFKSRVFSAKGSFALFLIMAIINIFFITSVLAADPLDATDAATKFLDETAKEAKIIKSAEEAPTAAAIIGDIVNIMLGFIGLLFFCLVIYGGIVWLTAGGNEEKAKKAVQILTRSTIGLIIIIVAFLLTNLIIFKVIGIATG